MVTKVKGYWLLQRLELTDAGEASRSGIDQTSTFYCGCVLGRDGTVRTFQTGAKSQLISPHQFGRGSYTKMQIATLIADFADLYGIAD